MHSSTSNFSQPTPEQPWKTVWVATLILTLLLMAGVEAGYRRIGIKPSISDVNDLWCFQRHTLHAASPETVVLAGSSRMHLGFSLDTWRKQLPDCPIVQLAIEGVSLPPFLNHGPVKISYGFLLPADGLVDRLFLFPEIFGKRKGCRGFSFPLPFSWGDSVLPPKAV